MGKTNLWYALKVAARSLFKRRTLGLIPKLEPLECGNSQRYIVSLTSYGKRLTKTAPYAIVTLLNQSVRPDKVVLWVANEDRANVPAIMKKLTEKGLEIRYCEDTRSYKKLIPAIAAFPGDCIITADDDIFYPHNWFEQLMAEHGKNPQKIVCHRAHGITVDEDHNPLPYGKWNRCIEPGKYKTHEPNIFPTGIGGILYPQGCLHENAANKELFTTLAPYADDIWFWAMAVINKNFFGGERRYAVVENSCMKDLWYVDVMQQLSGNALMSYNRSQGGNDRQLAAVIERYPEIKDVLKMIEPSPPRRV